MNEFNCGTKNRVVRQYFYLRQGLSILNEFKYLIAGLFALYYTFKLTNPLWLVIIACVSIPLLALVGYVYITHASKVLDWLSVEFSTYWSRYGFTLQEKQNSLLERLNEHLGGDHTQQRPSSSDETIGGAEIILPPDPIAELRDKVIEQNEAVGATTLLSDVM